MAGVTVNPPASPFASLLRRSRFATFDPQIRQTYYTPPTHAARGSWGLKRPIVLRRKNAFISLAAPFEDRAQFIEWSKAENEVRFIRRFEEMQVRATVKERVPWSRMLGSKENWLIDSEFCEAYEGPEIEEVGENAAILQEQKLRLEEATAEQMQIRAAKRENPPNVHTAGPGNYGTRKPLSQKPIPKGLLDDGNYENRRLQFASVKLSPNIDAMLPKEFDRYVDRIRQLRPKFKEFLQHAAIADARFLANLEKEYNEKAKEAETNLQARPALVDLKHKLQLAQQRNITPDQNLFRIAQTAVVNHHRRFIESHTASQFAETSTANGVVIEQRPHKLGGLQYGHPSDLHTHLFATPQPGIVLQATKARPNEDSFFVASFGGMTPVIKPSDRGDRVPLLDHNSTEGIKRDLIRKSIGRMRMVPNSVVLEQPPMTVGTHTRGLDSVTISSNAVVVGSKVVLSQTNPYPFGTMEYAGMERLKQKGDAGQVIITNPAFKTGLFNPSWQSTIQPKLPVHGIGANKNGAQVLGLLRGIMKPDRFESGATKADGARDDTQEGDGVQERNRVQ
ncbi:hypothetical protein BDP27DRAFT_1373830 [Rhodocollybia butyracea]|uniref:Uncharacterized protein n=1 Tax=Rhodocollybia butyracea TaxID=206335 RepID=A0A9P5TX18_9AGAR|nr:hypothetical protein BDP27DRAFT_1373830 [Rhodocollybia butyracea]